MPGLNYNKIVKLGMFIDFQKYVKELQAKFFEKVMDNCCAEKNSHLTLFLLI